MIYLSTKVQVWLRLKKKFENVQWMCSEMSTGLEPWEHVLASGVVIQELQQANWKKVIFFFFLVGKNYEGEFETGCDHTQNFLISLSLLRNNCSEQRSQAIFKSFWCEEQKRRGREIPAKFLYCCSKPGECCCASGLQVLCGAQMASPSAALVRI